nr:MAG TPA: hypothetical protein [Caudoviricetes sp.]
MPLVLLFMTLPELSADKSIQYATSVGLGAYLDATKLIFSCLIIIFNYKANTCLRNLPSLYDT